MIIYENDDLLKECETDNSVIPAFVSTFAESSFYIVEAINKDFNAMFESIGIDELAVYESTGTQVVYEGVELSKLKEKFINFFTACWKKIKGAFENALNKVKYMNKNTKEIIKNLDENILDSYPTDYKFGIIHRPIDPNKTKYAENAKTYADEVHSEFEKLVNNGDVSADSIADKENELSEKVCEKISGINNLSKNDVTEMNKAIREQHVEEIEVDISYVRNRLKNMKSDLESGFINQIKNDYKESRKMIDSMISAVKKYTDGMIVVSSAEMRVLRDIVSASTGAKNTSLDIYRRYNTELINIFVKMVSKKKKEEKKEVVHNSVDYTAESYQLDQILKAFDF